LTGLSANGHRLTAQRRVVTLLDRRVEGVHVDVENSSNHDRLVRRMFALRFYIPVLPFHRLAPRNHEITNGSLVSW
jgi:hypothetical protein